MSSAQEDRADGWQRQAAEHLATIRALAHDLGQLRASVGEHAATIAEWTAQIPAGRVPARARLALAELQRLSASREPPAGA